MKNYFDSTQPATLTTEPNGSIVTQLWRIALLRNGKYDLNSGISSFSNVPIPLEYFEDASKRKQISLAYADYLQDFLYFTQHDSSVPKLEKAAIEGFGLCADEFADNKHWPYEPYIRGGRRLAGLSTVTSKDIFLNRQKSDSVAIGSYRLDLKPGLFIYSDGDLFRDWAAFFKAPIYEIPFSAMLPRSGVRNLIASVSISSSPLAFSSLRMEIQFMALGQAAGIAAWVAVKENKIFHRSMVTKIQSEQGRVGALIKIRDVCKLMSRGERLKEHFDARSCTPLSWPFTK